MSYKIITHLDDDLMRYPKKEPLEVAGQLTLGDLHGNALKLVNFLVRHNVLDMSENDYLSFARIYVTPAEKITQEDIKLFKEILQHSQIKPEAVKTIRLIGDELCDRGSNDYFTLKILEKLGKKGIHTEILLSNHGGVFLKAYLRSRRRFSSWWLKSGFSSTEYDASLRNMGSLIKNNLIKNEEVEKLVERYYKPNLRAISYTVDKTQTPPLLTLFTHAPCGLETIQELAIKYGVKYNANNIDLLCKTIDKINEKFSRSLSRNKLDVEKTSDYTHLGAGEISKKFPLLRLMWNRCTQIINNNTVLLEEAVENIQLPEIVYAENYSNDNKQLNDKDEDQDNSIQPFALRSVHGHIGSSHDALGRFVVETDYLSYKPNMVNLDNDQGKFIEIDNKTKQIFMEGNYTALYSDETPAKDLNLITDCYKVYGEELSDILFDELMNYYHQLQVKQSEYQKAQNSFFCSFGEGYLDEIRAIKKLNFYFPLLHLDKYVTPSGLNTFPFTDQDLSILHSGKIGKVIKKLEKINALPRDFIQAEMNRQSREFVQYRAMK